MSCCQSCPACYEKDTNPLRDEITRLKTACEKEYQDFERMSLLNEKQAAEITRLTAERDEQVANLSSDITHFCQEVMRIRREVLAATTLEAAQEAVRK